MSAESYLDLMQSAPHWGFEITLEALTGLVVYPLIRMAHKRLNDRLHRELDAEHGVIHPADRPFGALAQNDPISHVLLDSEVFVK